MSISSVYEKKIVWGGARDAYAENVTATNKSTESAWKNSGKT